MARPSPAVIHDLAIKHRIGLNYYSTMVVRKVIALLNRTEMSIVQRLAAVDAGSIGSQRLETLLTELQAIQHAGALLVQERMNGEVRFLADAEARFAARLAGLQSKTLGVFSPIPSLEQIVAAVNARPFQGRFLSGWLDEADAKAQERVRNTVRQGFVEGMTTPKIITALRGTRANRFQDGVLEISRRGAEAMVRTALTHTANVAAQTTWSANKDVVLRWQFIATLDSRTTLVCAGLHGKEFPLGEGPQPPRHINCRSTSVPVLDPIPGVKPYEIPSYENWLRAQPAELQDEILGVMKGKLFRDGGLTISDFTDNKGKVLTLDELRQRDEDAFRKAGL